ncbi:sulfotransferase 1b1-like protein [Plakobranchus ocellatus]|uniref:Sulfotransferase 1b1-like protein n=1 Tax=Plakobranchus ocellatus TaxID=259542 RepID=A0AAV4BI50_9GAST|nr:sulfotransferase 1b1-like protein [Plakobranchus ocellatus]
MSGEWTMTAVRWVEWWAFMENYVRRVDNNSGSTQMCETDSGVSRQTFDRRPSGAVQYCSFDNMKNNGAVNLKWLKDEGIANKDVHFMRNGEAA